MPVRSAVLTQGVSGLSAGADMRIYQQLQWGRLASLHVLDGRQYRDVQDPTRADSPVFDLARFEVAEGHARVEPV